MADDARTPPAHLSWLALLERAPFNFDFHAALRRLECIFHDQKRFGEAWRPSEEPIRVGQEPSTAFAPSAVTAFQRPSDGVPGKLMVAFFGMFGPRGPLPVHLTEYARDRMRNSGDRTLVSFIDLFHHRMFLLFHRAWANAQPTVCQDRPESNRFNVYVGSLFGLALRAARERDLIPDRAKLHYAGRLSSPTRNAEGLRAIVADYFGLPVDIEQFIGGWLDLPEEGRWSLGDAGESSRLGRSTVLGRRTWQCAHQFRVVLGPLSRQSFQRFLPGSKNLDKLAAVVRTYVGDEFSWDVRLVLEKGASDQLQLTSGGRLGWNTRLGFAHQGRIEDLVVNPFSRETKRMLSRAAA
jgi:type VI secretion system protein ImpH